MDTVLQVIEKYPQWLPTVMAVGACIWIARQWIKAIERNHTLATKFAGGQEASNQRLTQLESGQGRIEGRLEKALEK